MNNDVKDLAEVKKTKSAQERQFKFMSLLNRAPSPQHIESGYDSKYLKIGYVESLLDSFFPGWSFVVRDVKVIGNSCVTIGDLIITDPVTRQSVTRSGVGAVPIELKSEKKDRNGKVTREGARHALDFERINPKAIQKGLPASKSYAIKNAAQSIGDLFGRSLNRTGEVLHVNIYAAESVKSILDEKSQLC